MSDSKPRKTKMIVLAVLTLIIVAGLAVGATLLFNKRSTTSSNTSQIAQTNSTKSNTKSIADTSQYKLTSCTSGAIQTIDNASFIAGTDIAPGSYKIVSQTGDIGWTNVNIYNSKQEWINQGSKSVEQGTPDQSFEPDNGTTTYTKLTDGQFMQIDGDPATFTCE